MTYIKKNRETKTTMDIKRVYNKKPGSQSGGGGGGDADDTSSDAGES
jgi:hypothetical protein